MYVWEGQLFKISKKKIEIIKVQNLQNHRKTKFYKLSIEDFSFKNIECIEVHFKCIYTPAAQLSCHQIFIIMVLKKVTNFMTYT